nr:hypothetical protein [Pseudomonadota bacterium]
MAFDSNGDLYVSSFATNEVLRFNGTTGLFEGAFANLGLAGPTGLLFDSDSNLYVANETSDQILRFAGPNATFPLFPGAPLPAPLRPGAIYVDGQTRPLGGGLTNPQGMTFGPDGHLYVNSSDQSAVFRYSGPTSFIPGDPPPGPVAAIPKEIAPDGDAIPSGWTTYLGCSPVLFGTIDQ